MPLRNTDFISSVFALAEPVPFTVAILIVKSLIRLMAGSGGLRLPGLHRLLRRILGLRPVDQRLLHVPGGRRATLGAEAAVHTEVLVLDHHARRLRQRCRHVERLSEVARGDLEAPAQFLLRTVAGDGETVDRTDVEAGVALDAELGAEDGLHVTVETALHFLRGLLRGEAELDFYVEL